MLLYLSFCVALCESLFDVLSDRHENLLDIQVCFCTLQNSFQPHRFNKMKKIERADKHVIYIFQLTVSKNLIPYSSARACPFDVGTACRRRCSISIQANVKEEDMVKKIPFCFRPYQLYYQPRFC